MCIRDSPLPHSLTPSQVIADVFNWKPQQLAYRIRKQGVNHYHADYLSLHVYCSPAALKELESKLRLEEQVLRWKPFRRRSLPKLSENTRKGIVPPRPEASDLLPDPIEAAKYEYRNLVMQRVFDGRTKQEMLLEQLARQRISSASRPPNLERTIYELEELRRRGVTLSTYGRGGQEGRRSTLGRALSGARAGAAPRTLMELAVDHLEDNLGRDERTGKDDKGGTTGA